MQDSSCVSGDCSLLELLQEVRYSDRVDDVIIVRTATTTTFSKQDTELDLAPCQVQMSICVLLFEKRR